MVIIRHKVCRDIYLFKMAVSKVKAIRPICKRVTVTPYKNKSPYLKEIMIQNIKKYICMYICKKKKKLPVAVTLLKKKYNLIIYIIYISIKIS